MIQISYIDHVVLRVVDLAEMLAFYCDVLGCTIEKPLSDAGLVQLRAGGSLIDLVTVDGAIGRVGGTAPGKEGRNLDHFCVRIEPFDETVLRRHLARHGVTAGSTEVRYGAEGEGPSIYIEDPQGNVVELKGLPQSPPTRGR